MEVMMENREGLKMLFPVVVTGIYSLIVVIGGVIGYQQAQSEASLYMGLTFGLLLCLCELFMISGKKAAYVVALILMCILALFFGYRFALTQKFMPAGMMLLITCLSGFLMLRKNPYQFKSKHHDL